MRAPLRPDDPGIPYPRFLHMSHSDGASLWGWTKVSQGTQFWSLNDQEYYGAEHKIPMLFFFFNQCEVREVSQSCLTLCNPMVCSLSGSSVHGIFPGKTTGVGCHFLLQSIFQTQQSNLGLPNCKQILYHLSYQGSPFNSLKIILCVLKTRHTTSK